MLICVVDRTLLVLLLQLRSFSSFGPQRSSSWSTARRSVWLQRRHSAMLSFGVFWQQCAMSLAGMEGPVGGRRFLAPALLHHPAGDYGAAEALSQQPEVGLVPKFHRRVRQHHPTCVTFLCCVCFPRRFSHSPLIDDDDDDDEEEEAKEPMLIEAFGEQVLALWACAVQFNHTLLSCWTRFCTVIQKEWTDFMTKCFKKEKYQHIMTHECDCCWYLTFKMFKHPLWQHFKT